MYIKILVQIISNKQTKKNKNKNKKKKTSYWYHLKIK